MQHRPVQLVALDLDGTTVRSDGSVADRTVAAVGAVLRAGIRVVVATGRPPRFSERVARELGLLEEMVCANGAATYHVGDGRLTDSVPIGPVLSELVDTLREEAPGIAFAAEWGLDYAFEEAFAASIPHKPDDPVTVADVIELGRHLPYKLLANHPERDAADLTALVLRIAGGTVEPSHSGLGFVEIAARGVTKAVGIAAIAERQGIDRRAVMAVGDAYNDLPMLAWAGHSVAMPGAADVVIEAADRVAPATNDEDGVALVLEALLRA